MLRVPGSRTDLLALQAPAAPTCASSTPRWTRSRLAQAHPDRQVVFFAVGFETTAPANAMAVAARRRARPAQLQHARQPRARAPGDDRDPRRARLPGAGVPGRRPRLRGHGLDRVRADRAALPGADRRNRLRAARPDRGHPDGRPPARERAGPRWRTSTPARCAATGNTAAQDAIRRVFAIADRAWRGIGTDRRQRPRARGGVRRVRRRAPLRGRRG